MKVKLSIPYQK